MNEEPSIPLPFDDDLYLSENPGAARAVLLGDYANGYEHYLKVGKKSGLTGRWQEYAVITKPFPFNHRIQRLNYFDPKVFPVVCAWGPYRDEAKGLQRILRNKYGRCHVIASFDDNPGIPEWHSIGEDAYFGAQWGKILQLFNSDGRDSNILFHIQADARITDIDYLHERMIMSYHLLNWGVWMPNVDWTWLPLDKENQGDRGNGLRSISRSDCTAWAIHEIVIRGQMLDPSISRLGWGFDWYYSQVARSFGMEVIQDLKVDVIHPKATNYNQNEAKEEFRSLRITTKPGKLKCLTIGTPCGNRGQDLQRTLRDNLDEIQRFRRPVQWIISDWGTTDPEEIPKIMDVPLPSNLEVQIIRSEGKYNYAAAKNVAIDNARGDYYLSLDADNFIGRGLLREIHDVLEADPLSILHFNWMSSYTALIDRYGFDPGFVGKIAMITGSWLSLGGFEEELTGYGGEDTDLVRRALYMGLRSIPLDNYIPKWGRTIPMEWFDRIDKVKESGDISEKKAALIREIKLKADGVLEYKTCRTLRDNDYEIIQSRIAQVWN